MQAQSTCSRKVRVASSQGLWTSDVMRCTNASHASFLQRLWAAWWSAVEVRTVYDKNLNSVDLTETKSCGLWGDNEEKTNGKCSRKKCKNENLRFFFLRYFPITHNFCFRWDAVEILYVHEYNMTMQIITPIIYVLYSHWPSLLLINYFSSSNLYLQFCKIFSWICWR